MNDQQFKERWNNLPGMPKEGKFMKNVLILKLKAVRHDEWIPDGGKSKESQKEITVIPYTLHNLKEAFDEANLEFEKGLRWKPLH